MSLLGRCTHHPRRLFLLSLFPPCPYPCRASLTTSTTSSGFTPAPPPHFFAPPRKPAATPSPTPSVGTSTSPSLSPHAPASPSPQPSPTSPPQVTPPPPTPKTSPLLKYPLGPRPSLRPLDRRARDEIYDTLLFLLRRQSGREYGLRVRDDGYLGVRSLLNYPMFRHMDLLDLQSLIEADGKYRFELRFDPSKGEEAWWIRAKLWDEKKYTLVPCRLIHGVRTVVYKTTLDEWNNHISRSGIPLLGNDYIQLDRTINTPEYINTLSPHSAIFIFIDAQTALLAGLRFFFLLEISAHVNRHTPLLTRGNHLGLIPPSLFARVSLVEAAKTLIWSRQGTRPLSPAKDTEAHPGSLAAELARFGHRPWPKEDLDVTPLTGRRGTYLPYLGREMHAFADLPGEVFLRGGRTRRGGDASASAVVSAGGAEGGGGEGGGGTGVEGGERGERAMGDAEAEGADTGRPARSAGWSGFLPLDERTVEEAREVLLSASSEAGEAEVDSEGVAASSLSSPSSPSPSPSTASPKTTPPPPPTLYTPTGLLKPFNPPPGSPVLEVPEPVPSEGSEFEFEYELQSWSGLEGKGKDLEAGNGAEARGKAGADVKAKSSAGPSSMKKKKKKKPESKTKGSSSTPPTPNPSLSASPASEPSSSATAPSHPSADSTPRPPETPSTPTSTPTPTPIPTSPPSPNPTSPPDPSPTPETRLHTASGKKETSKERNIRKREERRQRARERSLMAREGLEKFEDARGQESRKAK